MEFVDARARHEEHPDTFEIPEPSVLGSLRPGDFVKVCAESERFWVKLTHVYGDLLMGIVDNELITDKIRLGDGVTFLKRNVFDVDTATEEAQV